MIRKLPQEVINRMAAGEVIKRPLNVIKELVENSIDAGATNIIVSIKDGGRTLIKVEDNGKGINADDYPLLCTRFATSKISDFSDLQSLSSFGFRGEALASLSYVSNLTISSRRHDEQYGHIATFKNENILEGPSDISHQVGTKIVATNLFQNQSVRRQSINPNEQRKKIEKLLSHFTLHYWNIKFTLSSEKCSDSIPSTPIKNSLEARMSLFQQITKLSYDKFSQLSEKQISPTTKIEGIFTKLNSCKGKTLLLNINNRIVENNDVFKAVQKAYSECYRSIHEEIQCFFVYLSIEVEPKSIDCNVHPTKKAVGFFGAKEIYEQIQECFKKVIQLESTIKILKPSTQQSLLSDMIRQKVSLSLKEGNMQKRTQPQALTRNRNDSKQLPLQYFMPKNQQSQKSQESPTTFTYKPSDKSLKTKLDSSEKSETRSLMSSLTYVGCIGLNYIFMQKGTRLVIINIIPYLQGFILHALYSQPLSIKSISFRQFPVEHLLHSLIQAKKLKINVDDVMHWLNTSRKHLEEVYGIILKQVNEENTKTLYIESYPCINEVFVKYTFPTDQLKHELAFLICRVYNSLNKGIEAQKRNDYMVEFMSAQFRSQTTISAFNQRFCEYFEHQVVPVLKTQTFPQPPIQSHFIKEILDLQNLYKIFERC